MTPRQHNNTANLGKLLPPEAFAAGTIDAGGGRDFGCDGSARALG